MIQPVHTKIPGRARFKVAGLHGSEPLKRFLESRLVQNDFIVDASGNAWTGNILVRFQPHIPHRRIAALLQKLITETKRVSVNPGDDRSKETSGSLALTLAQKMPAEIPGRIAAVKDRFKQMVAGFERQPEGEWHLLDGNAVLAVVESDREAGLSVDAVRERIKRYGPNLLPDVEGRSKWEIFVRQFMSLPVALLGGAAALSVITGGFFDAVVIMGVVVANAVIGYTTESAAERTIQSLKGVVRPTADVIREGWVQQIPGEDVTLGDVLLLKPGTYVPADCRVLESSHLSIDESVLTGESMPVIKRPRTLHREEISLADRTNMAYMGTLVTGGEGTAVVVGTGSFTEVGRLQLLLQETTSPETPIERQLRVMGDQLVLMSGAICGIVFLIGFLRGYGFLQMLRTGISLAAAAVPEGLPAAATINFALGIRRMREHHVLIRHLQAVETLGAVQTVCLDKTGTITQNRMAVMRIHAAAGTVHVKDGQFLIDGKAVQLLRYRDLRELAQACVLCNETKVNGGNGKGDYELSGSPTENALIHFAIQTGVDVVQLRQDYKLLKVNYRAENRLFMSTLHGTPDTGRLFIVKGSPREVLSMCRWQFANGKRALLTDEEKLAIETENEIMAGDALRVLGVACKPVTDGSNGNMEEDLTWLGLIGMADPIRRGVKEVMQIFHSAGIDTVMITGDQSPTAYAVANELGLSKEDPVEMLDSRELTSIAPELMEALAARVHVYSRVSPAHKLRIVRALQSAGKTVAMTGDGINDGPALKAADIGIAMGRTGTDVAREVADVVLEDDELETLIIAVRDGRSTYTNIRKSVHFFLSTNMSEIMVMFAAMAGGIGFPLNVMQLLWINIISDIFPGLALSLEPPEPDVLKQPPRNPKEPLFSSADFKRMAFESGVISTSTLGAYGYGIARYGMGARAGSVAFQSLTIGQLVHAMSCRSEKHGILNRNGTPTNKHLNAAIGGSLALQVLTMAVPGLRRVLGLTPLNLTDMIVIGGSALLPFVVNETTKGRRTVEATSEESGQR